MKKLLLILIIISLFQFCKKKNENKSLGFSKSDSLAYYLSKARSENSNLSKKIVQLDKASLLVDKIENTKRNRATLFVLMLDYYNLQKWNKFQFVSKKLLYFSELNKDSTNIAYVFRYKGGYFKRIGMFDSSFIYYLKAEKYFIKQNNNDELANNFLNKGIVQYSVSDYLGAELSLSKAYYILKESSDKNKLYRTLNQLGLVCNELKEYERAADYHLKALQTVKENNLQSDEHQEAVCYNNLGYLYIKQNKYKDASKNFEAALQDKTIVSDDPELYSSLIDNLAFSRMKSKNSKDLPQLFYEAINIRKKLNDNTILAVSYIHLSEYYQTNNNNILALNYSNEALRIATLSKIPVNIILALKQASLVDEKRGLKYSEDYIRISDSLQIVERNSKDRFARLQLETDELKQENFVLEEKNRDILNYLLASVLIFGSLIYMRTQRAKNRYLILEQAQQRTNEDIYRLIISQQDKLDEGKALEKVRISKELHDGILGRLFGLRLHLDGLNQRHDQYVAQERINCLNELRLIEQDLREISHDLSREKTVLINNFISIVDKLLEDQLKVNKAKLTSVIDDKIKWDLLSNTTKINLYRIVQECLQNVNKYAKAKNITVAFKKDIKGNLILSIFDDGVGFEVNSKNKGIGITNIIQRTHESLGTIDIKSSKNKGTSITIMVPLESKTIKI